MSDKSSNLPANPRIGVAAIARRGLAEAGPPLMTTVVALLLWEWVVKFFQVPEILVPAPSAIVASLVHDAPLLAYSSGFTLAAIGYGFALSAALGITLALLLVRFPAVSRATYPLIVLFQTVPKVALAPIFVIWFGYDIMPKLLLIVVISFFPISLNMIAGLRAVDPNLLLLMRSVGCSNTETMWRVMVPSALPHLFAGLKIAVTFAVIGAIVAEFSGSNRGLGYLIQFGSSQLQTPLVFAGLFVVSAIGVALYYVVALIERLVTPWSNGPGD
ncbi:MAG: ABC transporter permease [Pseudorhodoplanes sp.]|nr:ABC transporter permease [Pseudorhodoplanes sp.]